MELEALEGAALTLERQILTCEGLLNSKPLHVKRSGTLSKAIIGLRGNFYDFLFISRVFCLLKGYIVSYRMMQKLF